MKQEKDSKWTAGLPLIVAGAVLMVFGTLLVTSHGVPPVTSVKLMAGRVLILPFAVSRWFDVVGWAAWASFLAKFFLNLRGNEHAKPWIIGGGLIAFAIPGMALSFASGIVLLLEIAAIAGAVLGFLIGAVMRTDDFGEFMRGWYRDGGCIIGPGLGIGVSFIYGTAVGIVFAVISGLIASLAYGAMLLITFGMRRLVRGK